MADEDDIKACRYDRDAELIAFIEQLIKLFKLIQLIELIFIGRLRNACESGW